jgi:hypothetical protein
MQRTPRVLYPWRFVLLILPHFSRDCKCGVFRCGGTKDYQKTIFRLAGDGGKFFTAGYRIADAMAENAFSVLI